MRNLVRGMALSLLFGSALMRGSGNTAEEHAQTILRNAMDAKDAQIRVQAVIASSMIGKEPMVLLRLERALTDKDVAVRIAAANALGDFKSSETAPALRKALHDDDVPEVAFAAAKALYTMKDPAGQEALTEVFNRQISAQSGVVRKQTRDFFAKFHSVKSSVMAVLSQGIGFVPVPGVGAGVSAISELLADPELSARASVLLLIGRERTPEATDLLRRGLYDKDWTVRAAAAQAIAQTARVELRQALIPVLDDTKEKVSFRAAGAYLHLTAKGGRPRTISKRRN